MMDKTLISPGEIAKKYNISYQTINYYTNLGLFVVRRRIGHSRLYRMQEVQRCLDKIARLKNQGYSLKLICDILRKKR